MGPETGPCGDMRRGEVVGTKKFLCVRHPGELPVNKLGKIPSKPLLFCLRGMLPGLPGLHHSAVTVTLFCEPEQVTAAL